MGNNSIGYEIDLLPVGNADRSGNCIVLRYGNLHKGLRAQKVIIVDGGFKENTDDLKNHLRQYYNCEWEGKLHIDLVVITHAHIDHMGGILGLIQDEEVEILSIWTHLPWNNISPAWFRDGRITRNSLKGNLEDAFNMLKNIVDKRKSSIKLNDTFNSFELSGASFYPLSPSESFFKKCIAQCSKTPTPDDAIEEMKYPQSTGYSKNYEYENYKKGNIKWDDTEGTDPVNESSIVFLWEYYDWKILFCGDAGKEALENAIEKAQKEVINLNDIDIIVMPHHGSRRNVNPDLMENLKGTDTACYISCVRGDEPHHPSSRLVNMLREKGFKVFSTSGATLHRGVNAPDRNWRKATQLKYDKIEK